MERPAHQQRVIDEQRELDIKLAKLAAFLNGTVVDSLDLSEQVRLHCQAIHMTAYSVVLGARIAAFK